MEEVESILYHLLDIAYMRKWREEAEAIDHSYVKGAQQTLEALRAKLDEDGNSLLSSYAFAMEENMDFLIYMLNIKALNIGVKIGMQLAESFREFEND